MKFEDFIIRDPKVHGGIPWIKGTEIPLKIVVAHLALGDTAGNILKAYPSLTREAVQAVITFSAIVLDHQLPNVPRSQLEGLLGSRGLSSQTALTDHPLADSIDKKIRDEIENKIKKYLDKKNKPL